jgi:hypothetical protein
MCEYCENGKGLGDSIEGCGVFINGGILLGIYDSNYCNCEAEIHFCPMCGRKLTEDNDAEG